MRRTLTHTHPPLSPSHSTTLPILLGGGFLICLILLLLGFSCGGGCVVKGKGAKVLATNGDAGMVVRKVEVKADGAAV